MKYQLIQQSAQASGRPTWDVKFGEDVIGQVFPYLNTRWHAALNIPIVGKAPCLIQGFSDSPEEAVKIAIEKGFSYYAAVIVAIYHLEQAVIKNGGFST